MDGGAESIRSAALSLSTKKVAECKNYSASRDQSQEAVQKKFSVCLWLNTWQIMHCAYVTLTDHALCIFEKYHLCQSLPQCPARWVKGSSRCVCVGLLLRQEWCSLMFPPLTSPCWVIWGWKERYRACFQGLEVKAHLLFVREENGRLWLFDKIVPGTKEPKTLNSATKKIFCAFLLLVLLCLKNHGRLEGLKNTYLYETQRTSSETPTVNTDLLCCPC